VNGGFIENSGRAFLTGVNAELTGTVNGETRVGQNATLLTDGTSNTTAGLKSNMSFAVEGRFGLVIPEDLHEGYGIRLTDSTGPGTGDSTVSIAVRRDAGGVFVNLLQINFATGTATVLDSIALSPAGANQIVLRLAHNPSALGVVAGSFDLLTDGALTSSVSFGAAAGQIFEGENWTRAVFFANGAEENVSYVQSTYNSFTVDQTGHWTTQLRNGLPETQALDGGQQEVETFQVQATDNLGASSTQAVTITTTGVNDNPRLTGDLSITLSNGGSHVLTAEDLLAVDPDATNGELTFIVSNIINGKILAKANDLSLFALTTTFTQAQLLAGWVKFEHDGSATDSGFFTVSVSDGVAGSTPALATVTVAVPTMEFRVLSPLGFDFHDGEPIMQMGAGKIQANSLATPLSPTQFTIIYDGPGDANDRKFVFEGNGFAFTGISPSIAVTGGTITAIHAQTLAGGGLFDFIGNVSALAWFNAVVALAAGNNGPIEALTRDWTFSFTGNNGGDAWGASDGRDFFHSSAGNDQFDGQFDFDRASYSSAQGRIVVDLASGTVTKFTNGAGTAVLGTDTLGSIELITGSNFTDLFVATGFSKDSANAGSTARFNVNGTLNEFEGRGGDDVIVGNDDTRVSYLHALGGVRVDLDVGVTTAGGVLGPLGTVFGTASGLAPDDAAKVGIDLFTGVNRVRGSSFADVLIGSNRTDVPESFEGRGGNDQIFGNGGFDAVVYAFDPAGIAVNMAAGSVTGAHTGTDTLRRVEGVGGTEFADTYVATNFGAVGFLDPNSNNVGDFGTFNQFEGAGGDDTITRVAFGSATDGVTATLTAGGVGTSFGSTRANLLIGLLLDPSLNTIDPAGVGTDTFTIGVSRLLGSEFNDNFTGNTDNNILEGRGGNDVLSGLGGNDTLTGGTGADRFVYSVGGNVVITDFNRGEGAFSHDEGDRIDLRTLGSLNFDALTREAGTYNSGTGVFTLGAGPDTRITHANFSGGGIVLQGVAPTQLQGRDFLFAGQVAITVHSPGGYDFGTLLTDIIGVNPALTRKDATHYVASNQDAGLIFALLPNTGTTFTYDSNTGIPTAGTIGAIAIYDLSYKVLAGMSGVNIQLVNLYNAAVAGNLTALDTMFFNNATIRYSAIGSDGQPQNGWAQGDTFVSSVNNDFFNGRTGPNGDFGFGSDTVDYSHTPAPLSGTTGVTVDLTIAGQQGTIGAGLDALFNIENLRGSNYNDSLTGNGNSVLEGGAGADQLIGQIGGGGDTASYQHAAAVSELTGLGLTANLTTPGSNTGDAAGDTYNSIENLRGSAFIDTLTGDGNNNVLEGGAGGDSLNGGDGSDTASYMHAAAVNPATNLGVTANLASPGGNTGDAAGDTYNSIENLLGSRFNDTLIGNSSNNILNGFGSQGGGADILIGNLGADTFVFSGGRVTVADFNRGSGTFNSLEGDKIDLSFSNLMNGLTLAERQTKLSNLLIAAQGGDTIDAGDGQFLTLAGVNVSALSLNNFILIQP
jgi:VCBS repeat-containing protein